MGSTSLRRLLLIAVGCLLTLSLWLHLGIRIDSSASHAEIQILVDRAHHLLQHLQTHHQKGCPPCPSEDGSSSEIIALKDELTKSQASLRDLQSHSSITSTAKPLKWLVIGIPTVPRPNQEDYLLTTLARIHEQLPLSQSDLLYHQILVHIVHIKTKEKMNLQHARFEEARLKYADSPYFRFTEIVSPPQPAGLGTTDLGNANIPGYRVRKQTRDLAVSTSYPTAGGNVYRLS